MPGRGSVGLAIACACMALASCGGNDNDSPRAAAAPPPPPIHHTRAGSANVLVLVDLSKQMDGDRLSHAQAALDSLVRAVPSSDRVGLAVYADHFNPVVPVLGIGQSRTRIRSAISRFQAAGDSAAYDATLQAYGIQRELASSNRVNTVLLLAHSEDDSSHTSFDRVRRLIGSQGHARLHVRVVTVAYDTPRSSGLSEALGELSQASGGKSYSASQDEVGLVLRRAWAAL